MHRPAYDPTVGEGIVGMLSTVQVDRANMEKKTSALTTTVVAYSYEGHGPDVGITDRAKNQKKISQCRHAWLSYIYCLPLSVTFLTSPSDGYER